MCRAHDLFLFTDEIYEYFVYDGAKHICPATLDGMRERTIVMSGFSKTFSITGWRLGYACADAKWMAAMAYFHDLTYVCAPSAFQHGAAAGLEQLPPEFYTTAGTGSSVEAGENPGGAARCRHGAQRSGRRLLRAGQGNAFAGRNAAEKARYLLAATGVASVAGSAFFRPGRGENLLRFCFAKKDEDLDEACARLRRL